MKGLFKKLVVGATSIAMVASMGTAFAQTEMSNMVFAGYDTTDPLNPNKVYNEVIGGKYTNKQILVPVDYEWKVDGFEGVYPYAGYSRMYIEGNPQTVTVYNHLSPQWETRRRDYMWEMAYPYTIYERHQTKVENQTWQWDFGNPKFGIPDSDLLTPTYREATVLDINHKDYGFGKYQNNGDYVTPEQAYMYSYFGVDKAISTWEALVADDGLLSVASLSATDEYNRYIMTDEIISSIIPVVKNKYITAKFNPTGTEGLATKSAADEFLIHGTAWDWDADSLVIANDAEISWSKTYYEMAEPYYYYQFLIVNGVPLDGKDGRERIVRYTGGKASPVITWKFAFFQNATDEYGNILPNVYEVVERKYVDGVPGVDADKNPIYRVPTGEYGNTYFVVKADEIEYWVLDDNGNSTLLNKFPKYQGYVNGAVDDGVYDADDLADAFTNGVIYYEQAE